MRQREDGANQAPCLIGSIDSASVYYQGIVNRNSAFFLTLSPRWAFNSIEDLSPLWGEALAVLISLLSNRPRSFAGAVLFFLEDSFESLER